MQLELCIWPEARMSQDRMPFLLVIDDEPLILDCFRHLFTESAVTLKTALTAAQGLELFIQQPPDAVVLDINLPDMPGLELFQRLRQRDARVPIILMTGHGTAATAIEAMRLGAYEYLVKPLDPDEIELLVARAFEISRLMRVPAVVAEAGPTDEESDLLVGRCPAMQEVFKGIGRVASQDVTVLILGECGTGKELVARALYHYSKRSSAPFLAINCAAIPEALLESDLFGHEKGSFTGADRKRIGKFEQCNGGTLFLDEIGDMSPATQAKILRVLQDQQFERVGGNESLRTNVRGIAATNRDLERMMAHGRFRSDLYYRLNVYSLRLPALRERIDDVPLLTDHFVRRFNKELSKEIRTVAPEALELLRHYPWPGNVRELQSILKQALLQATGPVLLPDFLPATIQAAAKRSVPSLPAPLPLEASLTRLIQERLRAGSTNLLAELIDLTERHVLSEVLHHAEGNQSQAARILGISRGTLRTKMATHGLAVEHTTCMSE
jgi:two-component system, NtrC family, nitrogen regulation response regulator GlnG